MEGEGGKIFCLDYFWGMGEVRWGLFLCLVALHLLGVEKSQLGLLTVKAGGEIRCLELSGDETLNLHELTFTLVSNAPSLSLNLSLTDENGARSVKANSVSLSGKWISEAGQS